MWWSFASSCHRWRVEMSGMWVYKETLRGEDHYHDNKADFHDFHFDLTMRISMISILISMMTEVKGV